MSGSKAKSEDGKVRRRTVLRNSAIAVGGLAAASGTASAGKKKKKKGKKKKKSANAGWALAQKKCYKFKKYEKFKVIKKTGTDYLPAGCSSNSKKKKYVCYKVKFINKGDPYYTFLYRRKSQPQFEVGAKYKVKHVKSCGKNCRVHFKRK